MASQQEDHCYPKHMSLLVIVIGVVLMVTGSLFAFVLRADAALDNRLRGVEQAIAKQSAQFDAIQRTLDEIKQNTRKDRP